MVNGMRKNIKVMTLLGALWLPLAVAAATVPDFSAMTSWGGGVIETHDSQYGYAVYYDGAATWLVLEHLSGYRGNKALWEYVDHIRLPDYDEDSHHLIFGLCRHRGVNDSRIAAIVRHEDKAELDDLLFAWQADLEAGKISAMATTDVTCVNESYGM